MYTLWLSLCWPNSGPQLLATFAASLLIFFLFFVHFQLSVAIKTATAWTVYFKVIVWSCHTTCWWEREYIA